MENKDLIKLMKEKASLASAFIHGVSSVDQVIDYSIALCRNNNLKTISAPDFNKEDKRQVGEACQIAGLEYLESPLRDRINSLDIALTWSDYGIAETGTLVMKSDDETLRIATMLSTIHIAVLPISKIKETSTDIEEVLDTILKSESPSYTAFITGPSRTADIERVLAIGVHGPIELHVLLMDKSVS